ncbi:MAG: hypothetical protein PWP52_353 [Bacteroidales bacterium]|nr:hypothetical protein [Bacteroidales bacterium]
MKRLIVKIKFDNKVKIEKFEIPAEQPLERIASNLACGLNLEEKLGGGKKFWFESETGILDMHKTLDQLGFKNGALLYLKNGRSIPEFKPKGPKPYNGGFINSKS